MITSRLSTTEIDSANGQKETFPRHLDLTEILRLLMNLIGNKRMVRIVVRYLSYKTITAIFLLGSLNLSASNIPEYKYDYSKKINNELGKAIYQNRVAEITNAVNAGADVQGYINDSPFLSVILHGDCKEPLKPLIELLLSKGANPNARDDIGKTPLMVALNHCSVDIINLLLDHGGDLELSSNHGYSPLLYSVFSGNMETVKIVIERTGIKFNSNAPEIPLISAVEMGAVDIVHLLVKSNIDQCVVNPFNLTARDYAVKYNKLEMMSLLSMQCGEP